MVNILVVSIGTVVSVLNLYPLSRKILTMVKGARNEVPPLDVEDPGSEP
jgi:hypothetical protein